MSLLKTTLMVLALSIGRFLWAQEPVYNWGEPCTKERLGLQVDQLLSLGDDGFAVLKSKAGTGLVKSYWIKHWQIDYGHNLLFVRGLLSVYGKKDLNYRTKCHQC